MLVVEVLRSPHLVLTNTCANDRFALSNLVQTLEDVMWLNEVAIPVVIQRMILLQFRDMEQPRREVLFETSAIVEQILQSASRVGHMGPCDLLGFADFRRIDIDVRDVLCIWRKCRDLARHTVIES